MSQTIPSLAEEEFDDLPHVAAVPDLGELARVSAGLETQPASEAVRWAWETFKDEAVLAASFQDCVLIDVAMQVAPDIEVVFLDTQYHFAETLWYVEQVRDRYDLNLRVVTPRIDPDNLWQVDTDSCCEMRKVEPLARALDGKAAWLTGLRRDEAPTRATAPIVGWDVGRGIVKVNPLASWSHDDIDGYVARPRAARAPTARKGVPVDRVLAVHAARRRGRRPARRPLGGHGQAGVRPPRLDSDASRLRRAAARRGLSGPAHVSERPRAGYAGEQRANHRIGAESG